MLVGCNGYSKMAAEFYEVGGGRGEAGQRQDDVTQRSTTGTDVTKPCMTVAERLRLYRERQEQIQRRGIETLKEMDARAEEYRRKQEEDRRRSMRMARTKEEEQRASVEERRRKILEDEHERRLLKLQKMWESNRRGGDTNRRKRKKSAWRAGMGSGAMSDGTLSSGGRTPTRPNRPHSIAGQVPNYALPTVASQIRSARRTSEGYDGEVITVCYRCRSTSPAIRQRSRSAEPPVRSGHHSFFKMAATTDLPVTSTFIRGTFSRSVPPSGASVFAPTQPSIPLPPRSSRSTSFSCRLTSKVSGSKPDDTAKTEPETNGKTEEGPREGEERKRKSFPWLSRKKNRSAKRPAEPSSEFRLFSFRHQDGKASMTVARALKTSGKATMEAFQQSRQLKPVQSNDVEAAASSRKVCRESGGHPTAAQPLRQIDRPTKSRPPSTRSDDVIKNRGHITMETDLDTLETRPVLRRSNVNRASAKRRDVTMETSRGAADTDIRPNQISVTKLTRNTPSSPSRTTLDRVGSRPSDNQDDGETADIGRADLWTTEDGGNSTISEGTSLDQFLEDSTSVSETAEDLDTTRKSTVSLQGDIPRYLFAGGVPLAQGDEDGLLEDDDDTQETVEIYEEVQIYEEVEVRRDDATELTLTLEKIVTEETLEIMYPDAVLHETGRGSVSSV